MLTEHLTSNSGQVPRCERDCVISLHLDVEKRRFASRAELFEVMHPATMRAREIAKEWILARDSCATFWPPDHDHIWVPMIDIRTTETVLQELADPATRPPFVKGLVEVPIEEMGPTINPPSFLPKN